MTTSNIAFSATAATKKPWHRGIAKLTIGAMTLVGLVGIAQPAQAVDPVIPSLSMHLDIGIQSNWLRTLGKFEYERVNALVGHSTSAPITTVTSTFYSCDNVRSTGSDLNASTPATPTDCTEITGLTQQSGEVNVNPSDSAAGAPNRSKLSKNVTLKLTFSNPTFVYWTNSVDFNVSSGGGTPPPPTPATLTTSSPTSTLIDSTNDLQNLLTSVPGYSASQALSGGETPTWGLTTPTVTKVSRGAPKEAIRTEAASMATAFNLKQRGGGEPKITVVNTAAGANIFGLIKNPMTSAPIGVPAEDVTLIVTDNQSIMLAAATENQPARMNASGVLVVNNGGLVGAAANGFVPNTTGELVIMSTPTVMGNFTTDANGSFSGQASLPAGLANGDHTVVLVTASLATALGVTVEPAASAGSAPYSGPMVTLAGSLSAVSGGDLTIPGENLAGVSAVTVGGLSADVISVTAKSLSIKLPSGLVAGVYDLVLTSPAGRITIQGAIRISAEQALVRQGTWTKAKVSSSGSISQVKIYAKDPIGLGKIQFFKDGKEIAWVRAVDETDPKLRFANNAAYLVRSVALTQGKNRFEIKVDGVRVWQATYVPKG